MSDFKTLWTIARQAPLSMGLSKQEYWSGLPFPSPEDLPNPGIEPGAPSFQADSLPFEPQGNCQKGKAQAKYTQEMNMVQLKKTKKNLRWSHTHTSNFLCTPSCLPNLFKLQFAPMQNKSLGLHYLEAPYCVLICSVVSDSATPRTVARQAPLSMGILQARIWEWAAISFSRGPPKLGIEPRSPTWQADSFPPEPPPGRLLSNSKCLSHCSVVCQGKI